MSNISTPSSELGPDEDGDGAVLDEVVDLTGEEWIVDAPSPRRSTAGDGQLARLPVGVKCLIIVRESNEFDRVLMEGMIHHTLAYAKDSPAIEQARRLCLAPLVEPAGQLPDLHRVFLRRGKTKAVLFEIAGIFFLYSMASAAKANTVGDNEVTAITAEAIDALRPRRVIVAAFSRLVRAYEHAGTLLHVISKHVDVLQVGDQDVVMRGRGAEVGQMQWAVLTMIAASERTSIVQRLTAGVVAKYRRGEWIKGRATVPLGYRLDPQTKTLVVDADSGDALRLAWTLMADPATPAWQILQQLADMGASTPWLRKTYGPDATVAQLKDAEGYLATLRRWEGLYRTGLCVLRRTNPFAGAPHIAGMPVYTRHDGRSELRFAYDFGRPDIDPELIRGALQARKDSAGARVTGGAARRRIAPLNGIRWTQDGLEFWVTTGAKSDYHLRVRGETRPSDS